MKKILIIAVLLSAGFYANAQTEKSRLLDINTYLKEKGNDGKQHVASSSLDNIATLPKGTATAITVGEAPKKRYEIVGSGKKGETMRVVEVPRD